MPTFVAIHRLKDFDEWLKVFKANPPPKVGRWRLTRGVDDPNRVHLVGEVEPSDVKEVKAFLASDRMQEVFRRVNAMSTAPVEFVLLEEVEP
jgi:hypothetical protein